jgi:hypothetical protein
MVRHIDLSSDWDRYTNRLTAVTEGMGRLFERVFNYSPISAILDEELVLQTIMLFNDRVY